MTRAIGSAIELVVDDMIRACANADFADEDITCGNVLAQIDAFGCDSDVLRKSNPSHLEKRRRIPREPIMI